MKSNEREINKIVNNVMNPPQLWQTKRLDESLSACLFVGLLLMLQSLSNALQQQPLNGFRYDYNNNGNAVHNNHNGDDDDKNDNNDNRRIHLSIRARPWRRWRRPSSRWAMVIVVITAVMMFDLLSSIIFFFLYSSLPEMNFGCSPLSPKQTKFMPVSSRN